MTDIGILDGEKCGRDGCNGVIVVEPQDGSCSCHINPPCSFCTDKKYYCPVCGWHSDDDRQDKQTNDIKNSLFDYKIRTLQDLDPSKIDYISSGHTHFSMIKEGVCPQGTTMKEVEDKVRGTFGGRFEYFNNGRFKYVAYTD